MRYSFLLILLFFTLGSCRKDIPAVSQQNNINFIGSSGDAVAYKIITLKDGGYALTGYIANSKGKDIFVSKFSNEGRLIWTKTYGEAKDEEGRSIIELADGGFMIGGLTTSYFDFSNIAYLIQIDRDGKLLWTQAYPHKATKGAALNIVLYDPLCIDNIHPCKDGSFNLCEYNFRNSAGNNSSYGGIYSMAARGQLFFHLEKIDLKGASLKDTVYNFHIPGHTGARKSNIFDFAEPGTGAMKTLEIGFEPGPTKKPLNNYYFWNGRINESSGNYSRQDSITTIAGLPSNSSDQVSSFLFGLNTALSPAGGMIISCIIAEKTNLLMLDPNGKNVNKKIFPGLLQGMNVSPDGKIALAGVSAADGSLQISMLSPIGTLLWTKNIDGKTRFMGNYYAGAVLYWGSPCTICIGKNGDVMAAFTIVSPGGGKTDIAVVHLNYNGELIP